MKWNIFSRSKTSLHKVGSSSLSSNNLDKKLVKRVHPQRIPTWSQLKYLGRFLNHREKKTIILAILLIIFTSLSWVGLFLFFHLETTAKEGGNYSEALLGQPKYINPLFSSVNDVDSDLASLVYSGLFKYNGEQKLIPDLAEAFTISEDKKVYDITLKPMIRWSDGEMFSAEDVVYTFNTIQNPETASPLALAFQEVQVEKTGDLSVRFTLKDPFAPFLHSLTVGILPKHIWSPVSDTNLANLKLAKTNLQPVGTGPWKFDKLVKKDDGSIQAYIMTQNDYYHGKKPFLKNLTFKFFDDCPQAFQEVQSHNVLGLNFVSCKSKDEINKKNLISYDLKLPQYTALFLNQENSLLKQKDLRLALAQGINKSEILQTALHNEGEIVDAPILKGSLGYHPDIKKILYNTEEANILLDKNWTRIQPEEYFKIRYDGLLKTYRENFEKQDKLERPNTSSVSTNSSTIQQAWEQEISSTIRNEMKSTQTFYRKDKQGNLLQLTITAVDSPEYEQVAELIAKQWQHLGIQTTVKLIRRSEVRQEILKSHNYQILLYGEVVGADPDLFPFWHSSQIEYPGLNLSLFSNRTADKILEDARKTTDEQEREELYKKLQDIMIDELPAIFLYSPSYTYIINKEVRGVVVDRLVSPPDRFNNLSDWYIKTKWVWK